MGRIEVHMKDVSHSEGILTLDVTKELLGLTKCTNETYFEAASNPKLMREKDTLYCLTEDAKKKAHVEGC